MGFLAKTLVCGLLAASALVMPVQADERHPLPESHLAEHERLAGVAQAEQERLAAMSPAERRALQRRQARMLAAADAIEPEVGGAWSHPFEHRSFGMHSALLPTGKVLFWSLPLGVFQSQDNAGLAWLWDPSKGTGPDAFKDVDPPKYDLTDDGEDNPLPAPLYCSGQSFLPDGRLLVAGGNLRWPEEGSDENYVGWQGVFTFDPVTETWQREPDMKHGRWYPSQLMLADGRTAIVGGYDESGSPSYVNNPQLELFAPGAGGAVGTLTHAAPYGDYLDTGLYPHLFVLPGGDGLMAGPNRGDSALLKPFAGDQAYFDYFFGGTNAETNRVRAIHHRTGGNGVLLPATPAGSTTVMQIGGWGGTSATPATLGPATRTTETLDADQTGEQRPAWKLGPLQNIGRSYGNTVLLPDGTMVTVGGGSGFNHDGVAQDTGGARSNYADGRARQVELWDPATQTWRLGAAQQEKRGYHSVALLLPDGRVLSSGDDVNGTPTEYPDVDSDTIEIYSPPYLFKGDRPVILDAPEAVGYDARFSLVSGSADVRRAVLMAPSATTHGADMTQRHVELQVTQTVAGSGLNVRSPADPTLAPPGSYMLFLLDAKGVPSVARWIRLGTDAAGGPLLATLGATPATAARITGETQTVTLSVRDANGGPVPDAAVRTAITGANPRSGETTTAGDGTAAVSWTGATVGRDTLSAYADLDGDSTRDASEPVASTTTDWSAPAEQPPAQQPPAQQPPTTRPEPPVIVEPPPVKDGLAPTVKLRVTKAALRALRTRGRLSLRLSSDEAGRATLVLRPKGRRLVLARATRTVKAGTRTVTLTLPSKLRRKLRRVRTVELRVVVKDAAGNTGRRTLRASVPKR